MDNERANAVLQEAERHFREEESHGNPAIVGNSPQLIGAALGFPPAEVLVLLRMLHRKGSIGLVGGFGMGITIARTQALLRPPTAVITDGGKSAKLGKGHRLRTEEYLEDESPPETDLLLDYIAQLERTVDGLQDKADQTERRRRNVVDARRRDNEAKASVEEDLRQAKTTIRTLTQTADELRERADMVPELERRLAALQEPRTVPKDLAETIARLTQ